MEKMVGQGKGELKTLNRIEDLSTFKNGLTWQMLDIR